MPDATRRMYPPLTKSWCDAISASAGTSLSVTSIRRETRINLEMSEGLELSLIQKKNSRLQNCHED